MSDDSLSNDLASLRINRSRRKKKKPRLGKTLKWVVGVIVIVGVGFYAYRRVGNAWVVPEVETGRITTISPAQESTVLTANGFVIAEESTKVGVASLGRVEKSHVREGDVVKKGDMLLELEVDDVLSRSSVAVADIRVAKKQAEKAFADLAALKKQIERQRPLVEKGVKGSAVLEDLEARAAALEKSYDAARAQVKSANAQAQTHRIQLDRSKITAPMGGRIISRVPRVGELVGPSSPPIEISDYGSLTIDADVPESRLNVIEPGKPCEITLEAYPERRYRCEVLRLGFRVDRAKATVPVKVRFVDPTEGVLPNMSAKVRFLAEKIDDNAIQERPKVIVPAAGLVSRNGKQAVFVVQEDQVRVVSVEVGERLPNGFELLKGPPPNTRIVLNAPPNLKDRQTVAGAE